MHPKQTLFAEDFFVRFVRQETDAEQDNALMPHLKNHCPTPGAGLQP